MSLERLASVSIDVDGVACYREIHGLPPVSKGEDPVWSRAIPRIEELLAGLALKATFFVIGRDLGGDLGGEAARGIVRRLHAAGHEIANHSLDHRYDLARLDALDMGRQVREANSLIAELAPPPQGFRAPGYTMSDALAGELVRAGIRYDSSVFPCPPYLTAKAVAMAWMRLGGRKSHAIQDTPAVLLAPPDPYRLGKPYWLRGEGLIELPIGVTPGARLPFIGTTLVMSGPLGARWLARRMRRRAHVNLELHGIDLCEAHTDGLAELAAHQPDLRVSLRQKREAIEAAIQQVQADGARVVTLAQAAEQFGV